jgi:hypothetical protein
MTTPTDFNCNDNSSSGSDIDRSAPADPLTTHSASSLSTSYSLDPHRPSPPVFHPVLAHPDTVPNSTFHRPAAGGVKHISLPLNRLGRFGKQGEEPMPSEDCLYDRNSSFQVSPSTLQSALDDNDNNLVNLTTTGIEKRGTNPTPSITSKSGHWRKSAAAHDPTMCSMNGGLTFRHMLHERSVDPSSSPHTSCEAGMPSRKGHCNEDSQAMKGFGESRSLSPGEPMLTFRAMLPPTPEEHSGNCLRDMDQEMRSSSAPTEFSPAPSSPDSQLTDPNASPARHAYHRDCCHNEDGDARDSSDRSGQDRLESTCSFFRCLSE